MPLGTVAFATLLLLERRRPLRHITSDPNVRLARNVGISAVTGVTLQLVFLPLMSATARLIERRRLGLLQRLPLGDAGRIALSVVLLDYSYYWWHRLLHQIPLLWQFHVVHHADRDMDVSTALRFHFGEWLLSTPYRALTALLLGTPERGIVAFELSMVLAIMFHHSNLRLPFRAERALCTYVVTPRMHGIHHSTIDCETNANFSTLGAMWDRLHRTLRLDVPQDRIAIGLPGYREESSVSFGRMLAMPFEHDEHAHCIHRRPLLSFVPLPERTNRPCLMP